MDSKEENEMLAWNYRKQQEQLALEADADLCLTAAWADTRILKRQMNGLESVKWR